MLVLAACWNDGRLRQLVERWSFPALLDRTIAFLGKLYELSPTCRADHDILIKLKALLFRRRSNDCDMPSSDEYSTMSV